MKNKPQKLTAVIETIQEEVESKSPKVKNLIERFERRGFGALLMLPSVFVILPSGAIPGVPLICGLFVIIVSFQILAGRRKPWFPERLKKIKFKSKNISKTVDRITPITKKIDRYIYPRLTFIFFPGSYRLISIICLCLGLAIILFGIIPFAAMLPALALLLISIGMSTKDGLILSIGIAVFIICGFMGPYLGDQIVETWQKTF